MEPDFLTDRTLTPADRRVFLAVVAASATFASLLVVAQFLIITTAFVDESGGSFEGPSFAFRVVNSLAPVVFYVMPIALYMHGRHSFGRGFLPVLVGSSLLGSSVWSLLHLAFGTYPIYDASVAITEISLTASLLVGIGLLGWALVGWRTRLRATERERLFREWQSEQSIALLQSEELRVRRDIADDLHGTLQNSLVLVQLQLADVAARLESDEELASLRGTVRDIELAVDHIREHEVRQIARSFYPEGLARGVGPAVTTLVRRLDTAIDVAVEISPGFAELDIANEEPLAAGERLLVFRIVEEGVVNAIRHGKARAVRIRLDAAFGPRSVTVEVHNNGVPARGGAVSGGLASLGDRVRLVGGELALRVEGEWTVLSARLPLTGETASALPLTPPGREITAGGFGELLRGASNRL
ncbi:sensor histidine kinase [Compostimonas suwonensis]|uniref:histidine kinase n=1 Tax=Compostimonas suwonensis TaxID=1048394 RepID=A0A2M9BUQ2_9MICO|nr:hypothetical protein [Compostimonas suwonensis]PJJ61678.1 signal transduction histidine kinase [Compostimonas suwonensis]